MLMRLVLCDDNRIFCEALAVALEARGHRALAIATTGAASVAAVARHRPDAWVLDLRCHRGGDGLGTARLIRDRYPETDQAGSAEAVSAAVKTQVEQAGVGQVPG